MNARNILPNIYFSNMNRMYNLLIVIIFYFIAMVLHDGYTSHIDFNYIWSPLIIFSIWGTLITLVGLVGWNTLYWCCIPAYLLSMIISILGGNFFRNGLPFVFIMMTSILLSFFVGIFLQIGRKILNRFTTSRQPFDVPALGTTSSPKRVYFKKIFLEIPSPKDLLAYHQTISYCLIIDFARNIAFVFYHCETTFLSDTIHCVFLTIVVGTIGYKGWKPIYTGALVGIVMDGILTIINIFFLSNPMKSFLSFLEYLFYKDLGASTMKIIWLIGINWFVVFGIVIGYIVMVIQNTIRSYTR
ncbi:hypothetical protein IAQ67_14605 [Paenibacillus peoriae]|uniref:Uncharacterized protein n=1 Tax=Paenibacillus peoriae TaxID=59893 RepID=A0A7H0Y238_9BACL|nr:hypothetical protein [Paenibacillus peoriae]QNR65146.1 hypothetical protein IAQ67_14605 [Paenibacillus peoriae]